jgi:hypothetical protein
MWKFTFFMDFHYFPLFNRQFFYINMFHTTGPKFQSTNLTFFIHQSHTLFLEFDIFIDFSYLRSLPGTLHPCCTCHPHQRRQKSHFTPWLHLLSSITINLFSLTIIIMPLTKHVTQWNIQCYMPYSHQVLSCMPRVMSHSPVVMAAPVKEWLLSYLVA